MELLRCSCRCFPAAVRLRPGLGLLWALCFASQVAGRADAATIRGVLLPEEEGSVAHYVGKFCFDFDPSKKHFAGRLEVVVDGLAPSLGNVTSDGGWFFAMYYDDERWDRVRKVWASATCDAFRHLASGLSPLTPHPAEGAGDADVDMNILEHLRPRFWYFVFLSCDDGATWPGPVTYALHATNPLRGYQREFSMDEQGVLMLHLIAFLSFTVLGSVVGYVTLRRFGHGAFRSRPLLTMLLWSCGGSGAGALCLLVYNLAFMGSGQGPRFLATLGDVFLCLARAALTSLQLVAAKGWGLLRSPQEVLSRRLSMCLLVGIVATSLAVELHGRLFGQRDWNTTLYFYASWSGIAILLCNAALSIVATWSMLGACKQEASSAVRLVNVGITMVSLLYFLTLPVICFLASVLAPWVRRKVVVLAETIARFAVTVLLAWCLRPSRVDAMIDARMALPEHREQAVELADPISNQGDTLSPSHRRDVAPAPAAQAAPTPVPVGPPPPPRPALPAQSEQAAQPAQQVLHVAMLVPAEKEAQAGAEEAFA